MSDSYILIPPLGLWVTSKGLATDVHVAANFMRLKDLDDI